MSLSTAQARTRRARVLRASRVCVLLTALTSVVSLSAGVCARADTAGSLQVALTSGGTHSGSPKLAAFTELFAPEERAARGNVKLQITKCRKLFYDTAGWNAFLIPGAAGIAGPRVTNPAHIKEISTPAGDFIDVAHVCAGLDAANHPAAAGVPGVVSIASNLAAVTWAGDLGSVLSANYLWSQSHDGSAPAVSVQQANLDRLAPAQDLLADIDAYVISAMLSADATKGVNLGADLLNAYYAGPDRRAAPAARLWTTFEKWAHDYRWIIFASQVGLRLDGTTFTNESAWIDAHAKDVHTAAALDLANEGHLFAALTYLNTGVDEARTLLRAFVDALHHEIVAFHDKLDWR